MTGLSVAERNLANAQKSTGPQSAEGKARAARNATRHGATSAPPEAMVLRWLSIILNRPVLAMADLDMARPSLRAALDLAQAEARHVQAVEALQDFEAGDAEPSRQLQDDLDFSETLLQLSQAGDSVPGLSGFVSGLYTECWKRIEDEVRLGGKRHRLLKRYVRETKSARKTAFEVWLAAEEGERGAMEFGRFPETKPDATAG